MTTSYSYIRFSSRKQLGNTSLLRQLERAREYAKQQGWQLDESLQDLGVSAFKGKNRDKGHLSNFLKLVRENRIPKGSWLIIEHMDRLSREEVGTALQMFLDVINAGVGIVTLTDGQKYTRESVNTNPHELMLSIVHMAAAHDYSAKLSMRVRKAWEQKRRSGKPITGKAPFWITLDKQAGKFRFNDRLPALRRIIKLGMEGHGTISIAATLNREGVKPPRGRYWHYSTIQYVQASRTLIGEYQPKHLQDGRYVAMGDPVANYYPAAMTEKEFYALQAVLATRKTNVKGRTGNGVANVFGRTLISGWDGSTLAIHYHPNRVKYKKALQSLSNRAGIGEFVRFPYELLEEAFFKFVYEVELDKTETVNPLDALQGELAEVQKRADMVEQNMIANGAIDRGMKVLRKLEEQAAAIRERIEQAKMEQQKPGSPDELRRLVREMKRQTKEQQSEFRSRLKVTIPRFVTKIELFTAKRKMRVAGIARVTLVDGYDRYILMRVERGKEPLMAVGGHEIIEIEPKDPRKMLDDLLALPADQWHGW